MNCDITMDNGDMDFVLEDAFRIVKMRMDDDDGGGDGGEENKEGCSGGVSDGGEGEKHNIDHNNDQMLTMMI